MDKRLEELWLDLAEYEAYRELQSTPFDFGTGLIRNESQESEDVYYKMEIQAISDAIVNFGSPFVVKPKRKTRYKRSEFERKQRAKLQKIHWSLAYHNETHLKRCYYSRRKRWAKFCTNKAVRNATDFSLKGGGYRRVYNYWWYVF